MNKKLLLSKLYIKYLKRASILKKSSYLLEGNNKISQVFYKRTLKNGKDLTINSYLFNKPLFNISKVLILTSVYKIINSSYVKKLIKLKINKAKFSSYIFFKSVCGGYLCSVKGTIILVSKKYVQEKLVNKKNLSILYLRKLKHNLYINNLLKIFYKYKFNRSYKFLKKNNRKMKILFKRIKFLLDKPSISRILSNSKNNLVELRKFFLHNYVLTLILIKSKIVYISKSWNTSNNKYEKKIYYKKFIKNIIK